MKWICKVCGYIHEGAEPPALCPVCKVTRERFEKVPEGMDWAAERRVGKTGGLDERVVTSLRDMFNTECREVGVMLAMSRAADREGYPEVADVLRRFANDEAEHAARMAELLGEDLTGSTKENLQRRVVDENRASQARMELARLSKQLGYDAIREALYEVAREEARHGKAMEGLLKRYFLT